MKNLQSYYSVIRIYVEYYLTKIFFTIFILSMNDISFTSRINFVDRKAFDGFRKGDYVDFRANNDLTAIDLLTLRAVEKLTGGEIKHPRLDVLKSDEFYTEEVRTCSAGGVVDTKTGEAVGFHIYDSFDNSERVQDVLENIFGRVKNPDRALILGSKNLKFSTYSIPIFRELYEGIAKRVPNVTIFREHTLPFSESNMHYSLKNDTWTIQSMYRPLTGIKEFDVSSQDELNKCFKEIRIANGDVVTFGTK